MGTLILVEHDKDVMNPSTRCVLHAASQLDEKIVLLVAGRQCQSVAEQAASLKGVHEVWYADHEVYAHPLAENMSQFIATLAPEFSNILVASSTYGKNILPRVAALIDVAQVSDVTRILDHDTFEHPIYAGNAIETVRVLDDKKLLTIRTTAFEPISAQQDACLIRRLDQVFPLEKSQFISHELSHSTRPDLSHAEVIVSGGRALQSAENFKLIEALADALGGAVGASRAAVDAGFVPNDYQVGQTGKVVAPTLYIAVGISGAVQHLAGMKESKIIVAINKDEDAPIFQIATYGLVGDLFELVPQFIEHLKQP